MNIAERILQNRFTLPKSRKQKQNDDSPIASHNTNYTSPQTNNSNSTYNNLPQQRMYYIPKQNIQYKPHPNPMSKSQSHHNIHHNNNGLIQTTYFNIGTTINTNTTNSRPQSTSTWQRNKGATEYSKSKSTNNLSTISNAYNASGYNSHNKPPIKVKQSYTPPSYPPNNNNSNSNNNSVQNSVNNNNNNYARYKPKFKQNINRKLQMKNQQFNTMQPIVNNNNQINFKPLPKSAKRRSAVVSSISGINNQMHNAKHRPRNKNNTNININNNLGLNNLSSTYKHRPLPKPLHINIEKKQDDGELPLGWAKLKDNTGYYYFNVITAEKQRTRPTNDATQHKMKKSIPSKPLPLPYSRDVAPSVITDDMSIAEIEYRKQNGSLIFGKLLDDRNGAKEDQLIQQENWDMLVDAIYLNLTPLDYITVFKALRSIAENLFDEDDKYRILYADNKKVQQRILTRIGGYEFLRGLGFREVTKRKLVCDYPDFDVVATAITAINAKLSIIEKDKPLPIIPDKLIQKNNRKNKKQQIKYNNISKESVDLDVGVSKHNEHKQEEKDEIQIIVSEEKSEKKAPKLVKLELDNIVSDVIKSDGPQQSESSQHASNNNIESYDDDEDEKKIILRDTNEMDITETPNANISIEGRNINNNIPDININNIANNNSLSTRERIQSKVTSAYFSEEEDEKLGIIMKSDNNMETDAGYFQTEQYFKMQREILQNRKRSLSWSKKKENKNKHSKKPSDLPYQKTFFKNNSFDDKSFEKESFSPKSNHSSKSQHRHTLPPKNLVQNVKHAQTPKINYVIRKKKKSSKKRGRRQKAHTQHQIGHQQQRSSSVSSPRTKVTSKKNSLNAVKDIENEVARAFIDSQKKITLNELRLHEEEDVESLFDDDDDINYDYRQPINNNIQYTDVAKPHDDFYVNVPNKNQNNVNQVQQSRDDFGMINYNHNQSNYNNNNNYNSHNSISGTGNNNNGNVSGTGYNNYNSENISGMPHDSPINHPRNTFSDGNLQNIWKNNNEIKIDFDHPMDTSPTIPTNPKVKKNIRHNKPRSNSFGNNPFERPLPPNPPVSLLLPSEKKKIVKKSGKKKRAQKIRKSVGAFFSHFTSKKNPKYTVEDLNKIAKQRNEYRAQHPSDEEENYAYYGDPQKQNNSPAPKKLKGKNKNNSRNISATNQNQNQNEYFMAADDDYLHIKSPDNVNKNKKKQINNSPNNSRNISGTQQNNITSPNSNNIVKYTNTTYVNNNKFISQGYVHNPPDLLQHSVSPSQSNKYSPNEMKSISVSFADETVVNIDVNINICSINLISLALEKRGWSSTMTHLFNLCIKDDDPSSDSVVMATLEHDANPIKSLPQFVKHLELKNPIFVITYKQNE